MLVECLAKDLSLKNLKDLNDEFRVLNKQEYVPLGYAFNPTVGVRFSPTEETLAVLTEN